MKVQTLLLILLTFAFTFNCTKEISTKSSLSPSSTVHIVQPGDTLWFIAEKYYGDGTKWERIFAANYEILKDPPLGLVGQRLIIPLDIKYAYIIYDHNHAESTRVIEEYLNQHHVYLIGRYGRWKYMSMEDAILDVRNIAEKIRGK